MHNFMLQAHGGIISTVLYTNNHWCCRDGGREAGLFCALSTLSDQLLQEGAVDVYQTAKLYHLKRPGMLGSQVGVVFTTFVSQDMIILLIYCATSHSNHLHIETSLNIGVGKRINIQRDLTYQSPQYRDQFYC